MRGEFHPFAAPLLGDEEIDEVVPCLRSGDVRHVVGAVRDVAREGRR